MIQPLRRAHRWAMTGLTLLLPMIFVAGLAARRPVPQENQRLPGVSASNPGLSGLLQPFRELVAPDLMVYWSPSEPSGEALPADAQLLGSLYGLQTQTFPPASDGYLLLYSLAHQRLITKVPLKQAGQP